MQQATERQAELSKIQADMDAIQKHLADNETHRALAAMEQRIRHLESVAFTLRDGILSFFLFEVMLIFFP